MPYTTEQVGTVGETFASEEIATFEYPFIKLRWGDTGVANDVTASFPFPVDIINLPNEGQQTMANSISVAIASNQSAVPVDGSAVTQPISAASLPLPTGAATAANQLPDGHNVAITGSVTVDSELPAAAALAENAANPTAPAVGAFLMGLDGATWDRLPGSSADGLLVNLGGNNDVTIAGVATAANQLPDGHNVTVDNTTGAPANVQIGDGTSLATVRNLAANDSLNVAIVDGAGDQITSFGGGTQYTAGTDTFLEGTTVLTGAGVVRNDAGGTLVNTDNELTMLQVDASGNLRVTGGGGGTEYTLGTNTYLEGTSLGAVAAVVRYDAGGTLVNTDNEFTALQVDANGNLRVTGGGGGTEYTEGNTDATITGSVAMMEVAADTIQPIQGSVADGLLVNLGTNNDVTVTGTVTANAGTNLNTSALALETGGNLATLAGAVAGTEMQVDVLTSALPTGAATSANQLADNHNVTANAGTGDFLSIAGHTLNEALKEAMAIGGQLDDTAPTAATENNVAPVRITAQRGMHVNLRDNAGAEVAPALETGGNLATIAGAVAGTEMQVDIVADGAGLATAANQLPDGHNVTVDNAVGNGVYIRPGTGVNLDTANVTIGAALPGGDNNIGNVDVVTSALPTGAATSANQTTQTTALQLIDNPIVAHDAVVTGSTGVNMVGFTARSSDVTAVGNNDASRVIASLLGKQVEIPYSLPGESWSYAPAAGGITDTAGDTARAAQGAGIRNYVTRAQIINADDTVGTDVQIRDGAAGTVLWRGWAQELGGGVSCVFDPPLRGSANTLIEVACGTTGSTTYVNLQGYSAAE